MTGLAFRALTVIAAAIAAAISWGIRIFLGAIAVVLVVIIGAGVAGQLRRERRRMADSIAAAGDDALALICDPCNGKPGTCTCASKAECSHPLCGAADTGVSDLEFSRELRALLDREGGRDGDHRTDPH